MGKKFKSGNWRKKEIDKERKEERKKELHYRKVQSF
jgi:hypothetical protein